MEVHLESEWGSTDEHRANQRSRRSVSHDSALSRSGFGTIKKSQSQCLGSPVGSDTTMSCETDSSTDDSDGSCSPATLFEDAPASHYTSESGGAATPPLDPEINSFYDRLRDIASLPLKSKIHEDPLEEWIKTNQNETGVGIQSSQSQMHFKTQSNTSDRWCDMCDLTEASSDEEQSRVFDSQVRLGHLQCEPQPIAKVHEHGTWEHPILFTPMFPMVIEEHHVQQPKPIKQASEPATITRKNQNLAEVNPPPNFAKITTLMIRGIPCRFSEQDVLSLVAAAGFDGKYDFFYMPGAGDGKRSLGYAFINFRLTLDAWTFSFTFHGQRLRPGFSTKTCNVSPAHIQGIKRLQKHFRRARVSQLEHGPKFATKQSKKEDV